MKQDCAESGNQKKRCRIICKTIAGKQWYIAILGRKILSKSRDEYSALEWMRVYNNQI